MLGQKRNDSLFGPGSRTIEAPQSVLEKQEAALEGSPLDEAVQPPFETQAPATAFTDADDLPRRTIATEAAAGQRVHSLFFTPESESKDFSSVLQDVQEYISGKYSTLITDGVGADTKEQIKRYISKYVQDRRIAVRDLSGEQLVDALYTEMAEFGFLTKYIFGSGIEEININSWRDIHHCIWSLWEECTDGQTQKEDGIYQLISNAENEMKEYAHKVKQLSADKIYQHSAETAAKENLLCSIIHDSYDLDDADLAKILQQEEPLDTLYQFLLGGKTDLSSESSISSILNEYNAQCQEETATMDTGVTLC